MSGMNQAVITQTTYPTNHNGTGIHNGNRELLQPLDQFVQRHLGPRTAEIEQMLETIGASSLDALIDETVPAAIRMAGQLNLKY